MMEKIPTQTGARDQLLSDLKTVIQDAEAWLRHSGTLGGEEFKAAKAKFERTIVKAKDDIIRLEEAVVEKTKVAAKATDEFVQRKSVEGGRHRHRGRCRDRHADRAPLMAIFAAVGPHRGDRWSPWPAPGSNWPPSNSRKTRAACSATSRGRMLAVFLAAGA